MSRLDDLKRERDRLKEEFTAKMKGWSKRKKEIYPNLKDDEQLAYRDQPPELKSMLEAAVQIYKKAEAVEKQIAEEEKRIAAQKTPSFRPQRYTEEERVCRRCGDPIGPGQVVCYRCLTIN